MMPRSAWSQNLTCTHFLSPARRSSVLTIREVRYESSIGSIAGGNVPCGSGATRRNAGAHARGAAIGRLVARMGSVSQLGATGLPGRGPSGRWRNPRTLFGAPVPWFGACPSGFPADPFYLYANACNPAYYPQGPSESPMNDMAMPDQPPLLPPPPLLPFPPMGNEPTVTQAPPNPPQVNYATERQHETSVARACRRLRRRFQRALSRRSIQL